MKKKRISKAQLTLSYKNRKLERQLPSKKCKLIKKALKTRTRKSPGFAIS